MYYKLIENGKIVDVLKNPHYVKWQRENNTLVSCEENEADGVLSSHCVRAYQIVLGNKDRFAGVVEMVEITQSEYNELSKIYPDHDNIYGITDDTFNQVKDDYREKLMQEVSGAGYNS